MRVAMTPRIKLSSREIGRDNTESQYEEREREKGQFDNNDVFLPAGGAGGSLNQAERSTQGLHPQTTALQTQAPVGNSGSGLCRRRMRAGLHNSTQNDRTRKRNETVVCAFETRIVMGESNTYKNRTSAR